MLILLVATVALAQGEKYEIGLGSFTKGHPKIDPRVVGGVAAAAGEFPYQVSLHLAGPLLSSHYCGGSIISESVVLTAGHCVTEVNIGLLQHVEILAGLISQSNPGNNVQTTRVERTIVNPDFAGGVNPNDLAIHIVSTPFKFNSFVAPIALPLNGSVPSGTVTLSGWGSTSHTQLPTMPDILQKVELPIVPYDECAASVEGQGTPLDETMVCTGPLTGGYGACSGDSGGPLVSGTGANRTLVGVVSWGFIPCAQAGVPSVFTRTSAHLEFIQSNMS